MRKLALTLTCMLGMAAAQLPPANTQLVNQAFLDLSDGSGTPTSTVPSNTVTTVVQQVRGFVITPDNNPNNHSTCGQVVTAAAGQNAVLTYQIHNTGSDPDTFTITTSGTTPNDANDPHQYTSVTNPAYYLESNGTPGWQADDTQLGTGTGSISLGTDETKIFYSLVPVPAGASAGDYFGTVPVGTSNADGSLTDTNNLGCAKVGTVYQLDMTQVPEQTAQSPDTIRFVHTITNTGNAPLTADQVGVLRPASPQDAYPAQFVVSTQDGTVSGAASDSPEQALKNFITARVNAGGPAWQPGEALKWTTTVSVPAGEPNAKVNVIDLKPYIAVASGGDVLNNTDQAAAVDHFEKLTVAAVGVGSIVKRQANCGNPANCPSAATLRDDAAYSNNLDAKPCDVVKYGLFASNTGTGNLYFPVLRDVIPNDITLLWVDPLFTAPAFVRLNGGTWQPIGDVQGTNPLNLPAGTKVEIAPDLNGDNAVSTADAFAGNSRLGATLYVRVNGVSCPAFPQPDESLP